MKVTYDDSALLAAMEQLPVKKQHQALKGGLRRIANKLKRRIVVSAESDGIKMSGPLKLRTKSVRVLIGKKTVGFAVTIAPKRKRGGIKPILPWLSLGTDDRYRGSRNKSRRPGETPQRGYTGRLKPRVFFRRATANFVAETQAELREQIINSCQSVFKRYCR